MTNRRLSGRSDGKTGRFHGGITSAEPNRARDDFADLMGRAARAYRPKPSKSSHTKKARVLVSPARCRNGCVPRYQARAFLSECVDRSSTTIPACARTATHRARNEQPAAVVLNWPSALSR
jgi:hypothetical protein